MCDAAALRGVQYSSAGALDRPHIMGVTGARRKLFWYRSVVRSFGDSDDDDEAPAKRRVSPTVDDSAKFWCWRLGTFRSFTATRRVTEVRDCTVVLTVYIVF